MWMIRPSGASASPSIPSDLVDLLVLLERPAGRLHPHHDRHRLSLSLGGVDSRALRHHPPIRFGARRSEALRLGYSQVMPGIRELVAARGGESLELWAKTINPQFARVLKTIGFDRTWARAEGAYLWDSKGRRYLDMLGGFGMFNVGRNNPRVRAALVEALELDLPGGVQLGVSPLPPLLAEALLARTPPRLERVLFTSSGTEAVEAALKLGRAATGRPRVVSLEHAFHGLTLGSLSANGNAEFTSRFGPLLPGFARVPLGDLDALERELRAEDVAVFLVEPVQGKGRPPAARRATSPAAQELCRRYGTLFCRRRGADRLRAHRQAVRVRALGPRARPRHRREVALGRLRARSGALLMSKAVHEARVRLDGERVQPRLDLRARTSSRWRPASRRSPRSTSRASSSAPRRSGRRLLELTEPLRERHAVVRDVRGLGLMWAIEFGEPPGRARVLPLGRAAPARPLLPARRRAALPRPPCADPGRRPRAPGDQGAAAARRDRGRPRGVRRAASTPRSPEPHTSRARWPGSRSPPQASADLARRRRSPRRGAPRPRRRRGRSRRRGRAPPLPARAGRARPRRVDRPGGAHHDHRGRPDPDADDARLSLAAPRSRRLRARGRHERARARRRPGRRATARRGSRS